MACHRLLYPPSCRSQDRSRQCSACLHLETAVRQGRPSKMMVACLKGLTRAMVDTIMVAMLTQNGGKETQGTAPRGPAIRKIDERITDTWRKTTRADKDDT